MTSPTHKTQQGLLKPHLEAYSRDGLNGLRISIGEKRTILSSFQRY